MALFLLFFRRLSESRNTAFARVGFYSFWLHDVVCMTTVACVGGGPSWSCPPSMFVSTRFKHPSFLIGLGLRDGELSCVAERLLGVCPVGGRGRLEGIIRLVAWRLSLICPEVAQGKDMAKLQRPSTVQ